MDTFVVNHIELFLSLIMTLLNVGVWNKTSTDEIYVVKPIWLCGNENKDGDGWFLLKYLEVYIIWIKWV